MKWTSWMFVVAAIGVGGALLVISAAPDLQARAAGGQAPKQVPPCAIDDARVEPFQTELLDVAFAAASALPKDPHVRTRTKLQEDAVLAALELDLPRRAAQELAQLEGWRRGEAYAELADWCARHGDRTNLAEYLEHAEQFATSGASQDWQRDRVRSKIARVHARLGDAQTAARIESDVCAAEKGRVSAIEAIHPSDTLHEDTLHALDAAVASGNFDAIQALVATCTQLYDSEYSDATKRTAIAERLAASWQRTPVQVRFDAQIALARIAIAHGDQDTARSIANELRNLHDDKRLTPDVAIVFAARIAELRHAAGDVERARREADAALARFDTDRKLVLDIDRANVLIPLAEFYASAGDVERARAVYTKCVDESTVNPNSRPRAEDLCAICCSLARRGVDPGEPLARRIRDVRASLAAPW